MMDAPIDSTEDEAPRKPPHNKEAWIQATDPSSDDSQQDAVHAAAVAADIGVVPNRHEWLERTPSSIQQVWQTATSNVQVWPTQQSPHSPDIPQDSVDLPADVLPVEKQWVNNPKSSPQPPILKRILSDHTNRQQSFQAFIKADSSLQIQDTHVKVPSPPESLYANQGQIMQSISTDWTEGNRVYPTTNPGIYSTSSPATYPTNSVPYSRSYPTSPGPYTTINVSYPSTSTGTYPSTNFSEPASLISMEKVWSTVPQTVGTIFKTGNSSPQVSVAEISYLQATDASPSHQTEWVIPSSNSAYKDIQNTLASAFVNPKDGSDTMWVGLSRHGLSITPEQEQLQEYFSRNAANVIDKKDVGLIWNQNIANETNCEVYSESLDGLVSYDKRPNTYPQSVNIPVPEKGVHKNHGKDSLNLHLPESSSKLMSTAGTQTMYTLPKVQYIHVHPPKSAAQKVAGQILLSNETSFSNHKSNPSPNQDMYIQSRNTQSDHLENVHHGTTHSPPQIIPRTNSELQIYHPVDERTDATNGEKISLENFPRKIISVDSRDYFTVPEDWQREHVEQPNNSISLNQGEVPCQQEEMRQQPEEMPHHQDVESETVKSEIVPSIELKTKSDDLSSDEDEDDKSSDWSQSSDEDIDYLSSVCSICGKQLIQGHRDKSGICNTCKLVRSSEKTSEEKLARNPRNKHGLASYESSPDEIKAENKRGRKSCKPKKLWVQSSVEEMSAAASAATAAEEVIDVKPLVGLVIPKAENCNVSDEEPLPAVNDSPQLESSPVMKRRRGRPRKSEKKGRVTLQKSKQQIKTMEPVKSVKDDDSSDEEICIKKQKHGKRKSVWRCRLCGSTYALQSQLTHHRQSVCTKRKCPECGVRFANKSKLARHMLSHSGLKPYGCHLCGKAYGDRGSLNAHNASHEGAKPFVCDLCGRQYTHKGSFKSHMRTHTGDKPFQCDHCGTQFSFRSSLLCHIKTHTGERPYTCDVCGKTFADRSVQLRHTRSHKGDKPYQCKECGKGFTQSGTLKIHMRKHTGDKPYICTVCHQAFICRSDLNKHARCHSADHKTAVKRSKVVPLRNAVITQEHIQVPVQAPCQVTPSMSEVIEYAPQNMDYTTMTKMEATDSVKNLIILSSRVEEASVQYVTNQLYRGNYVPM